MVGNLTTDSLEDSLSSEATTDTTYFEIPLMKNIFIVQICLLFTLFQRITIKQVYNQSLYLATFDTGNTPNDPLFS